LADASQVIRTSAAMVLEPTGIGVVEAPNQMQAWQALNEQSVDLILLESDFDPQQGKTFIDRLRSQPDTRDIPVILLAGLERKNSIDASAAEGILVKPFDSQDLIDRIEQALAGSKPVCPVCTHPVEDHGKTCPSCHSVHHTECWKLYDGCGKCQYSR
jgi:CheY-like chemotaxis protein